jgi:cardiolipin synthase
MIDTPAARPTLRRQVFTLANLLTFARMGMIPFFVLALLEQRMGMALGLLVLAGITDLLDGLLAREFEQRTMLGAYLDPITDKLLLSTAFVVLAVEQAVPWTMTILVLGRDVLILLVSVVIVLVAGFRPFPPTRYGKACTLSEVSTVVAVLLVGLWPQVSWLERGKGLLLWLTVVLVLWSGVHYAYRTAKMLAEMQHPS